MHASEDYSRYSPHSMRVLLPEDGVSTNDHKIDNIMLKSDQVEAHSLTNAPVDVLRRLMVTVAKEKPDVSD